jgi:hypothetical protein
VQAVGVNAHVWQDAGPGRLTECATGSVDVPTVPGATATFGPRPDGEGLRRLIRRTRWPGARNMQVVALD